jgi:hypothetical protein
MQFPQSTRQVRSKYGAVKTQIDGHVFASKAEAKRYAQLKELERIGEIDSLELQPKYQLAPGVKFSDAARATPALRYMADFRYRDHLGRLVVEDVKGGPVTEGFRIKKHLMLAIHGIEVKEVRVR